MFLLLSSFYVYYVYVISSVQWLAQ